MNSGGFKFVITHRGTIFYNKSLLRKADYIQCASNLSDAIKSIVNQRENMIRDNLTSAFSGMIYVSSEGEMILYNTSISKEKEKEKEKNDPFSSLTEKAKLFYNLTYAEVLSKSQLELSYFEKALRKELKENDSNASVIITTEAPLSNQIGRVSSDSVISIILNTVKLRSLKIPAAVSEKLFALSLIKRFYPFVTVINKGEIVSPIIKEEYIANKVKLPKGYVKSVTGTKKYYITSIHHYNKNFKTLTPKDIINISEQKEINLESTPTNITTKYNSSNIFSENINNNFIIREYYPDYGRFVPVKIINEEQSFSPQSISVIPTLGFAFQQFKDENGRPSKFLGFKTYPIYNRSELILPESFPITDSPPLRSSVYYNTVEYSWVEKSDPFIGDFLYLKSIINKTSLYYYSAVVTYNIPIPVNIVINDEKTEEIEISTTTRSISIRKIFSVSDKNDEFQIKDNINKLIYNGALLAQKMANLYAYSSVTGDPRIQEKLKYNSALYSKIQGLVLSNILPKASENWYETISESTLFYIDYKELPPSFVIFEYLNNMYNTLETTYSYKINQFEREDYKLDFNYDIEREQITTTYSPIDLPVIPEEMYINNIITLNTLAKVTDTKKASGGGAIYKKNYILRSEGITYSTSSKPQSGPDVEHITISFETISSPNCANVIAQFCPKYHLHIVVETMTIGGGNVNIDTNNLTIYTSSISFDYTIPEEIGKITVVYDFYVI